MSHSKEELHLLPPEEQLKILLQTIPQRTETGELVYLLTNGYATDLVTGVSRKHSDIDIVVLGDFDKFKTLGIDIFTPDDYLAGMKLHPSFLTETAQEVPFTIGNETMPVEIVHPAIIMVQKTTAYPYNGSNFPRNPKDQIEIRTLMNHWQSVPQPETWVPVIGTALTCLPRERRMQTWNSLKKLSTEITINRRFGRSHLSTIN